MNQEQIEKIRQDSEAYQNSPEWQALMLHQDVIHTLPQMIRRVEALSAEEQIAVINGGLAYCMPAFRVNASTYEGVMLALQCINHRAQLVLLRKGLESVGIPFTPRLD